jgi:hypothetical protein
MSDRREIPIPELIKISKKLIKTKFIEHDFYSLLVLAMATITEYSRVKRHINTGTRIDLAIAFVPDLIAYLHVAKIISDEETEILRQTYKDRLKELPLVMQSYVKASSMMSPKVDSRSRRNKWSCLIL